MKPRSVHSQPGLSLQAVVLAVLIQQCRVPGSEARLEAIGTVLGRGQLRVAIVEAKRPPMERRLADGTSTCVEVVVVEDCKNRHCKCKNPSLLIHNSSFLMQKSSVLLTDGVPALQLMSTAPGSRCVFRQ